ncbi:hypothetical protein MTBPR1_80108 [Candidatus Terasakiella magnetica]|uniref:Uncharacterized protein n=1 Tax=Candidatus Terasakiella magnetica TaxID=1867952 RepID=A0A1C3RL92_9PROT|nr:hypothetical protein MTBPR1_80108 [Candidatus Terasakiella magnetica]
MDTTFKQDRVHADLTQFLFVRNVALGKTKIYTPIRGFHAGKSRP